MAEVLAERTGDLEQISGKRVTIICGAAAATTVRAQHLFSLSL